MLHNETKGLRANFRKPQVPRVEKGIKCNRKMKFTQINLDHFRLAQDLHSQSTHESELQVALINEFYNLQGG